MTVTFSEEDRIVEVVQGLETSQMSRAYAAALLRKWLAEIRYERCQERIETKGS